MGRGGRGGLVGGRGTGDWRVGDALLEAAPGACTSLPKTRLSRWVWHKRGGEGGASAGSPSPGLPHLSAGLRAAARAGARRRRRPPPRPRPPDPPSPPTPLFTLSQ